MESLVLKRVTNLVHLVSLLHYRHLILLAQHDSQPFPPSMKCSAFGLLMLFVIFGNFCNFFGIFEHLQSQDLVISVEKGYKLVDLLLLLEDKHLILLPQHDCQPFPPSLKSSAFGILTLYVILGNFCNFLVYLTTCSPKTE